ncbi:hypothetical protein [Saccharococcus thermophilus]|uniref:Uncharacterized protein n=1 Tax=Saccharococcus thermophilus TaxID=29396 RepID=A0A846MLV5_9BACL|nr:hypothetical protein [Saccharococcus thermophilus]NIK16612.1 hypothetical protein [Saccharococcus thermophilus]
MIPGFVDELEFENVRLEEDDEGFFCIHFKINGMEYELFCEGKDLPYEICHSSIPHECEFCGPNDDDTCECLNVFLDEIYVKLKEHPNIRMKLLFMK